jgi:enoyl-CoA hydratase/carnithine racemase
MVALSRNVSRKAAMEMLLTGDMIPADQALQFGLVNKVVTAGELEAATNALANKIAAKAPATLLIGKEAFYHQIKMPLVDAYDYASRVMVANMMEPDAEEGIGAFVEKREPNWRPLSADTHG